MSDTVVMRLLFGLALALASAQLAAATPGAAELGVTRVATMAIPAAPLASRAQVDAYLRDTPPADSPLAWLTAGAQRRFVDSIVFGEHGVGGMDLGDLRYELTRQQAYTLLQLFGAASYALDLGARTRVRAASADSAAGTLEPAYDQLVAAESLTDGNEATMARSYQVDFAPLQNARGRQALGERDMTFLFRATYLVARMTGAQPYLKDLRDDFAELRRRQLVDRPHASDFYDALITSGQIEEAKALLKAWPAIERRPPPSMRMAYRIRNGRPSLWIATPDTRKRELMRFRFNIQAPTQVIVLASPGCPFSVNAARDIEAEPQLADLFREYGQWVAPPDEVTAFDAVRDWNQAHPALRLGIAYDRATLPMVRQIETPTFYFLDHGTVVDTAVGWPRGGNLGAIRRGLHRIGLLP